MTINDAVSLKICDFGVATVFDDSVGFECSTQYLTVENEIYQAPQVQNGDAFDARSADMWAVGQVMYQALSGYRLYTVNDILMSDTQPTGYWAVTRGKLKEYLTKHDLMHHFNGDCWHLLDGLLTVSEDVRWSASRAVNCRWFRPYNYCYDARVFDLFSLGTVLYHILVSQPLYDLRGMKTAETRAVTMASRNEKLKVYLMRSNALHRMKWSRIKRLGSSFRKLMEYRSII